MDVSTLYSSSSKDSEIVLGRPFVLNPRPKGLSAAEESSESSAALLASASVSKLVEII